jgi:putative MATE family efflux protein
LDATPPEPRNDERSVPRRLFDLALPVIGLNILGVLALVVDTAMCGRLPNHEDALNALGFATQIVFLAMVGMMGLIVGTVAFVARAHGAKDDKQVNHILWQSTQLTVLVSLAVAALGNVFAPGLLRLLGADDSVLGLCLDYLRPNLSFSVFFYLSMLYAAVLRGVGNTRLPFLVGIFSNALNVLLNFGLILGNFGLPQLGVQGAAIGTVISQACGVFLLVALLKRGAVPGIDLKLGLKRLDTALSKRLAVVGAPAALDMIILNAGFASIVGMLGHMDAMAVAAHGIGIRIQSLAFVPGFGVSQATGAMVGNALGAGDPAGARSIARAAMVLCTLIMTVIAAVLLVGAPQLVGLFEIPAGTRLAELSIMWIRILGFGIPIVGIHIAIIGVLRGAGATRTSLRINIVGTCIQIPLSYVLGVTMGLGPWGVWAGFPISFVFKAMLGIAAYLKGDWAKTGRRI